MLVCQKNTFSAAFWIVFIIFIGINFCGLANELTQVYSINDGDTPHRLIRRLVIGPRVRRVTEDFAVASPARPAPPPPAARAPPPPRSAPAPVPAAPRPAPAVPAESIPNTPPRPAAPAPVLSPPVQPAPVLFPPKYAPGYSPGSYRPAPIGRTERPPKPKPIKALLALAIVDLTLDNLQNEVDNDNAARYYLKGLPRPYMLPDDPPDSAINSPFYYNGTRIYKKNPCEHYSEGSKKRSNKDHKNGCRKARNRMAKIMPKVPSARCPDVGWARCFQASEYGRSGRCYVLVNQGDPSKIHFELITRCTPA